MNDPFDLALESLNSAFAADPEAMKALILNRVPCGKALADHPHVVVEPWVFVGSSNFSPLWRVSLIGVLNGVIQPMTGRRIAMEVSEPDESGQVRMLGFVEYPKCEPATVATPNPEA